MRWLSIPILLIVLAPRADAHEPIFTGEQAEQVLGFFKRVEDEPLEQLTVDLGTELDGWQSRLALIPTDELTHLMHARAAAGLRVDKKRAAERLLTAVRAFRLVQPLGKHAAEMAVAVATDPVQLTPLLCYEEPRKELFAVMGDLLEEKSAAVRAAVLEAVTTQYGLESPRLDPLHNPSGRAAGLRTLIERGLADPELMVQVRTAIGLLRATWDWAAWPRLADHTLWSSLPRGAGGGSAADASDGPDEAGRLQAAARWCRAAFQQRLATLDGEASVPTFTLERWRALLRRPVSAASVKDMVWRISGHVAGKRELELRVAPGFDLEVQGGRFVRTRNQVADWQVEARWRVRREAPFATLTPESIPALVRGPALWVLPVRGGTGAAFIRLRMTMPAAAR